MTDTYYLGWDDIKHVQPGTLPPYGFRELVPGSGVAVPDPGFNSVKPGWWKPNQMPADPIDLANMQIRPPGALGQYGFKELVPDSGVWIADPGMFPGQATPPLQKPLDMGRVIFQEPGDLLPRGYGELIPGSGVCLPLSDLPPRGGTLPAAHHEDAGPAAGDHAGKVFEVDYRQLEDFAAGHDVSAEQIAQWVRADPDFAERFLATHGKVAYASYLKIKEYTDSRLMQGSIYAHRNAATAESLRNAVRIIDGVDADNARRLSGGGPASQT